MKQLFIDLEETLITDWHDPHVGPRSRVLELLEQHFGPDRGRLPAIVWSFAISDDRDRQRFKEYMKPWLEDVFHLGFVQVVTMDEMCECTKKYTGFDRVPPYELIQTYRKDLSLEHWVRTHYPKDFHAVLLDDTVENKEVSWPDHNLKITYVHV